MIRSPLVTLAALVPLAARAISNDSAVEAPETIVVSATRTARTIDDLAATVTVKTADTSNASSRATFGIWCVTSPACPSAAGSRASASAATRS